MTTPGSRGAASPASGAALFAAIEASSLAVGFVTQSVLMRALGPEAYGPYALACAWGVLALTLTEFGFNFAGMQRAVELRADALAAHRHFWAVQGVKGLAGLASVVVALAWLALSNDLQARAMLLATATGAVAAWCFPSWFVFSRQRVITVAVALLLARCAGLVAVLLWVRGAAQWPLAIVLTVGAPVLAGLLMLVDAELRRQWRPLRPRAAELREAAAAGASTLWLSAQAVVSAAVLQSLLFTLATGSALGLFAAADRVRAGLQGLFTAFGSAVYPRWVQQRVDHGDAGMAAVWRLLRLQVGSGLVLALAVALAAPWIVQLVSGPAYADAAPVLRVLAFGLVTTTLVTALGVQVMLPMKQSRRYTGATLVLLLLQALGVAWLAPSHGALGAAWALVLAEGCVGLLLLLRLWPTTAVRA